MIRELRVSNFRSLGENVRIRFGALTVLVGPNGSGKSNAVDVISFVKDAMQMGLSGAITHRHGIAAVRRWSAGHPFNVEICLDLILPGGSGTYAFELRGDRQEEYRIKYEKAEVVVDGESHGFKVEGGVWHDGPEGLKPRLDELSLALPAVGGDERFKPLLQALERTSIYAIYPDTLSRPQKYSPVKPMSRHGDNWISILKDQDEQTWKPELISALSKLTGDIEDIRVKTAASYLVVSFKHATDKKPQKWFEGTQESDGTLRVAGILTALLQEPPLPVIGIEEPELTVHPGALPLMFDFLEEASERSQVIITTHSPELMDKVNAEDVRVVQRRNGITTISSMVERQRDLVREGLLTLGELMMTEGLQQDLPMDSEA